MKYFITGGSGQLGYDIYRELEKRYGLENIGVSMPDHEILDITNKDEVQSVISAFKPDVIFHCAAYTAVDKAESDCKNCYDVNVTGTKNIIEAAKRVGAKVIYVSTDYVFDGKQEMPYKVTDTTNPINVYGQTKLLGEEIAKEYRKTFIARTSWVFGINGKNFVKTMLRLASTKDEISVVSDQYGSPTYTVDLAKLLVDMSETEKYGTYHTNNDGYTSWYEFAKYIFESNGIEMKVKPIATEDYETPAKRPLNTTLDRSNLSENGFEIMRDWHEAIDAYNVELALEKEEQMKLEKKD